MQVLKEEDPNPNPNPNPNPTPAPTPNPNPNSVLLGPTDEAKLDDFYLRLSLEVCEAYP